MERARVGMVLVLLLGLVAVAGTGTAYRSNLDLLVVDDSHRTEYVLDNQSAVIHEYTQALRANSIPFDVYWVGNNTTNDAVGPSAETLKEYNTVIWFTGTDQASDPTCESNGNGAGCQTIHNESAQNLMEFMDTGGRLFLSGQYISDLLGGTNIDWRNKFFNEYLRTESASTDKGSIYNLIGSRTTNAIIPGSSDGDGPFEKDESDHRIGVNDSSDMYRTYGVVQTYEPGGTGGDGNDADQNSEAFISPQYTRNYIGFGRFEFNYCDSGPNEKCMALTTSRPPGYKSAFLSTGFEVLYDSGDPSIAPWQFMHRTVDYLSGPSAYVLEYRMDERYVSLAERDQKRFVSRCWDRQHKSHGDGVINASMVLNSSVVNNQDHIEEWDETSPILMEADLYDWNDFGEEVVYVNQTYDVSAHRNDQRQLGVNVTAFMHCKDENGPIGEDNRGYWGPFADYWFILDTRAPPSSTVNPPLQPSFPQAHDGNLTDDPEPTILMTKNDQYSQAVQDDIHEFRLACDTSSWGRWRTIGDRPVINVTDFDLEQDGGCTAGDGRRTLHYQIRDQAGNIEGQTDGTPGTTTHGTTTIWLDTTDPVLAGVTPANGSTIQDRNISIDMTDALTQDTDITAIDQTIRFSGVGNQTFNANTSFRPGWSAGIDQTPRVFLTDRAGNTISDRLEFTLDRYPPTVSVKPRNESYLALDDEITITTNENITAISSRLYDAGSGNQTFTSGQSFDPGWTAETTHPLDVWVNDSVDNVFADTYEYILDATPPVLTTAIPPNESAVQPTDSLEIGWTDSGSGIEDTLFREDGALESYDGINYTGSFEGLSEGYHTYEWIAIDAVSNQRTRVYEYLVDATPPELFSTTPALYLNATDGVTVTYGDPDSPVGSGIATTTFDPVAGPTQSFTNATPFDPGWSTEGTHQANITLADQAGNTYGYDTGLRTWILDTQPPVLDALTGPIDGYLNASGTITVTASDAEDDAYGVSGPSGLDQIQYDSDGTNRSITSGTAFEPAFPGEGATTFTFWLRDAVHNYRAVDRQLVLDTTPPSVATAVPANESFITSDEQLQYDIQEQLSGVARLLYDSGQGNASFSDDTAFDPGWSTEQTRSITLWFEDRVGNLRMTRYRYHVDDTPPDAQTNYTASGWQDTNASLELSCVDPQYTGSCDTVSYCTGSGCAPSTTLSDPATVGVGVTSGQEDNITVRFRATDRAGNVGPINTTYVPVDRRAPGISFSDPANNSRQGGQISFSVTVTDDGAGLGSASYSIINATDGSTVTSGSLSAGQNTVTWDSSAVTNRSFRFVVDAQDTLANQRSSALFFTVDNRRPSIDITEPVTDYHNTDVPVTVNVSRQGEDLQNTTYYVYNDTTVLRYEQSTGIGASEDAFMQTLPVPETADGNYSINVTAYDALDRRSSQQDWFVIDTNEPDVSINSPTNQSWQSGQIDIEYATEDAYLANCGQRERDESGWSLTESLSCTSGLGDVSSFVFQTGRCNDDTAADCRIEVLATDRAGNTGRDRVWLRVDNSLPVLTIDTPQAGAWFSTNFGVEFTTKEPQDFASLYYKINTTFQDTGWSPLPQWTTHNKGVEVPEDCSEQGASTCTFWVRGTNQPGDTAYESRSFSIDTTEPSLSINRYQDGANITPSDDFLVSYSDSHSGVVGANYSIDGQASDLPSGSLFDPGITGQGTETATYRLLDRAGNVLTRSAAVNVDAYDPELTDIQPANRTTLSGSDSLMVRYGDNFTGVETASYDIGSGFINALPNASPFEPSWSGTGNRSITFSLTDYAGRQTTAYYRYRIDTVSPRVVTTTPAAGSVISPRDLRFDVVDAGTGVQNASFFHGDLNQYRDFTINQSFDPLWSTEGEHTVRLRIYDQVDNLRTTAYSYTIDNSSPVVEQASLNVSQLADGDHLLITANVTDAYSSIKNATAVLENASSGATIASLPMTAAGGVWEAVHTAGTGSGTVNVLIEAYDKRGFRTLEQETSYLLDNDPPAVQRYGFNISADPRFGDHRLFRGDVVRFSADVTERTAVASATLQLTGPGKNLSLGGQPIEKDFGPDTRVPTDTARQVNLTRLWLTDAVGNSRTVELTGINGSFRTVRPTVNVTPAAEDALANASFSIVVDANRSYGGVARLFLPPSSSGSIDDPVFTNITNASCTGCNGVPLLRDGHIAAANLSSTDGRSTLSSTFAFPAPDQDRDYTVRGRMAGRSFTDTISVRAPNLSIAALWCGTGRCLLNQSEPRPVNITVDNLAGGQASGAAVNTTGAVVIGQRSAVDGPAIPSGGTANLTLPINASIAGNVSRSINVSVNGRYVDSNSTSFHVRDTQDPVIAGTGIDSDFRTFYVNESVPITVDAEDNLGVASAAVSVTYPTPGGNATTNISASSSSTTPADAVWSTAFNDTTRTGNYSVSRVWVTDTYDNRVSTDIDRRFSVQQLNLSVTTNASMTLTAGRQVRINASVAGNRTALSDAVATITKPGNVSETVDLRITGAGPAELVGRYRNTTRSGNYTANISVQAGQSFYNATTFGVGYGSLNVSQIDGTGTIEIPQLTSFNTSWLFGVDGGDVDNVTAEHTAGPALTVGSPSHELGNITYVEQRQIEEWALSSGSASSDTASWIAVNASSTRPDNHTARNVSVTVVPTDGQVPSVVSSGPVFGQTNIRRPLRFNAQIEDNSIIREAILQVENATGPAQNVTLRRTGLENFTGTFTPTANGTYNYTVFAEDIAGNTASGTRGSFEVFDTYSVDVSTDDAVYEKDSVIEIDVNATGVNGRPVTGFNSTIELDKNGTMVTLVSGDRTDDASYVVVPSDPPTSIGVDSAEYTVSANISKQGNTGSAQVSVPVYQILNITILEPDNGEYIPPGTEFEVTIRVNSVRGDPADALAYAKCVGCTKQFEYLDQNSSGVYYRAKAFASPSQESVFSIQAYANDRSGNTQPINPTSGESAVSVSFTTVNVSTGDDTGGQTGGGGGSSGGGGFGGGLGIERVSPEPSLPAVTDQANISVRTRVDTSCEYIGESGQARSFNTTGGQLHWSEVAVAAGETYNLDISCTDGQVTETLESFVFNVRPAEVESYDLFIGDFESPVEQGGVGTLPISVFNNGTAPIAIDMNANASCCRARFLEAADPVTSLTVNAASERSATFEVQVPLHVEPGTYDARLAFRQAGRVRERTVTFQVQQSQLVNRLQQMRETAAELNQTIQEYRQAGIDVTGVRNRYNELNRFIRMAEQAIMEDDPALLRNSLGNAADREESIRGTLRAESFKRYVLETWWQWTVGLLGLYGLFFLITMVAIPYYRLRTQYLNVQEQLEHAVEARKNAEKQYFRREIDRSTFMDIMTTRQDEILELRGDREDLEDELETAIRDRITVERFAKAPIMFVREFSRWIEARRTQEGEE